jgi:ABC-type multidrug transport system fused ATPase/permease subunit
MAVPLGSYWRLLSTYLGRLWPKMSRAERVLSADAPAPAGGTPVRPGHGCHADRLLRADGRGHRHGIWHRRLSVTAGAISVGAAYMIFYYTEQLRRPMEQIVTQMQDLARASASIVRVAALLATTSKIADGTGDECERVS